MFGTPIRIALVGALGLLLAGCGGDSFVDGPGFAGRDAGPADAGRDAGLPPGPDGGAGPSPADAGLPAQCSSGQSQSLACGACSSGLQQRLCGADGRWGPWGGCLGEQDGFPVRPADGTPLCPPYDRPAVFFAPHPDDEAIGMAGAIRQHVESGRTVVVELLTRGTATGTRTILGNGATCAWHGGSHSYALTPEQIGEARVREFQDAVGRLGAHGIFVSDFQDGALTQAQVATRIGWWTARGDVGLSLKGVAGPQDPRAAGGTPHPDHAAVWSALLASGHPDFRGYLVYTYTTGAGTPTNTPSIAQWCAYKGSALDAYRVWNPAAGRYAIGQHSVKALLDAAQSDCREFLVVP